MNLLCCCLCMQISKLWSTEIFPVWTWLKNLKTGDEIHFLFSCPCMKLSKLCITKIFPVWTWLNHLKIHDQWALFFFIYSCQCVYSVTALVFNLYFLLDFNNHIYIYINLKNVKMNTLHSNQISHTKSIQYCLIHQITTSNKTCMHVQINRE